MAINLSIRFIVSILHLQNYATLNTDAATISRNFIFNQDNSRAAIQTVLT